MSGVRNGPGMMSLWCEGGEYRVATKIFDINTKCYAGTDVAFSIYNETVCCDAVPRPVSALHYIIGIPRVNC